MWDDEEEHISRLTLLHDRMIYSQGDTDNELISIRFLLIHLVRK